MKTILQILVRLYQKLLSPFLGNQCRFTPTCSCYMHEALEKHGAVKGLMLGLWRILKCNPWTKSAWVDPVPEEFSPSLRRGFARARHFRYKTRKE